MFLTVPLTVILSFFGFRTRRLGSKVILFLLDLVDSVLTSVGFKDRFLTQNKSVVNREIVLEDWDAVKNGLHNSNTTLIDFDGRLYMSHQARPFHSVMPGVEGDFRRTGVVSISTWEKEGFLVLSVEDRGAGIPARDIDRVFEPFFSTDKSGTRSSFELNIMENAVKDILSGRIEVQSVIGKTTRFMVFIPAKT